MAPPIMAAHHDGQCACARVRDGVHRLRRRCGRRAAGQVQSGPHLPGAYTMLGGSALGRALFRPRNDRTAVSQLLTDRFNCRDARQLLRRA